MPRMTCRYLLSNHTMFAAASLRSLSAATLLAVCLASACKAQNVSPTQPTTQNSESLLIGPGDVLSVRVFDEPELTEPQLRVTDSGDIIEPFVGAVHVAGLTPGQAAAKLEQQFISQQYLLHPRISVTVEQFTTQTIAVVGQVKNAATYPATTGRSITEVIAQAGGLLDTADRHITIRRHSNGQQVSFFFGNSAGTLLGDQPIIYPGDTVFVPHAGTVYMLGDVARPGGYVMNNDHSSLTALQLLAVSGGDNHTARPARARLVRQGPDGVHETNLAMEDMRKGLVPDVPLLPDDIVYIPFSYLKNVGVSLPAIVAAAASAAVYVIR